MRPIILAIAARCARATGLPPIAPTRRDSPPKAVDLPAGLLLPAQSLAVAAETVFLQGDRKSFVRPDAVLEFIQSLLAARLREFFIRT